MTVYGMRTEEIGRTARLVLVKNAPSHSEACLTFGNVKFTFIPSSVAIIEDKFLNCSRQHCFYFKLPISYREKIAR